MALLFKKELLVLLIFINVDSYASNENKVKTFKQDPPSIQVVSEIYPPYQVINENGDLGGLSADKVKLLFHHSSIDYQVKIYPWARAYQLALTQPNIFIFSLLRTQERESLFQWVAPLCSIEFSFYRSKKRPDIQVNSLAEAKNYLIAVQKGQASAEYLLRLGFEPKKNLSISYNADNLMQMLVYDRVELIVLSSTYFASLIESNSKYVDKIEPIFPIDYLTRNLYLASSLNTSLDLINRLNISYDELAPQFDHDCKK
ncbi:MULTISPECIES: ABC transporter substrate-binding protein [unclassified Colwellia]|jgi:polar amino acid transport system substrate-binding protein|uniref:substrate-binding periplasmic protein n=1 Tax=unclassified Colwellia TaxID=196834 RepID=UPI0015F46C58|nr:MULTISPECIES: transporter substrate-binding domain-containing protein [unclassified Colwellia]MBA6251497.1 transporter substrate-binding domain-containing protein [Colwellia sp. MB3u-55]MBA6397954.1 transporter substrate-binding domain-containing protein [Colwellia sp. BRX10-4]